MVVNGLLDIADTVIANLIVVLLNIYLRLLPGGKLLSMIARNLLPMFDLTFLLKGGL